MPGVNVKIAGTTVGTTTDMDGKFSFTADVNETSMLNFSFIGFETKEVLIAGRIKFSFESNLYIETFGSKEELNTPDTVGAFTKGGKK